MAIFFGWVALLTSSYVHDKGEKILANDDVGLVS